MCASSQTRALGSRARVLCLLRTLRSTTNCARSAVAASTLRSQGQWLEPWHSTVSRGWGRGGGWWHPTLSPVQGQGCWVQVQVPGLPPHPRGCAPRHITAPPPLTAMGFLALTAGKSSEGPVCCWAPAASPRLSPEGLAQHPVRRLRSAQPQRALARKFRAWRQQLPTPRGSGSHTACCSPPTSPPDRDPSSSPLSSPSPAPWPDRAPKHTRYV